MSKISIQTEVDLKTLISSVATLKLKDLESFAQELNAIITRKKSKSKSFRDAELLSLHNQTILTKVKRERLSDLIQKMESETMTERERKELLVLTKEEEKLRNERVKILIELSQLRSIPFPQLMKDLGLNPPGNV